MEQTSQQDVYRKMLAASVSNILMQQGFEVADKECLGTLTEMLQCCKLFYLFFYPIYNL